jgi:hypothetical protein
MNQRSEIIAEEIVRQLGGRRFIAMTGAYDFLALESGVQFILPNAGAAANHVEIVLEYSGTHRVRFVESEPTAVEYEDIHDYELQELFIYVTGPDSPL